MKRLLPILSMALLGLSACDSGTLMSPLEPEVGEPSFAKVVLPPIELTEECPVEGNYLVGPLRWERETGAPVVKDATFEKCGFTDATLVIQVSDPTTTTVKAWLNGATVVLPSAIPRSGGNEVSVTFPLADLNEVKVRLSAKPGPENWVEFSVEGVEAAPTDAGGDEPVYTSPFAVTTESMAPTDDLGAACAGLGDYVMADWNDVAAAMEDGRDPSIVPLDGLAWITRDGLRSPDINAFPYPYYYMISADETLAAPYFPPESTIETGPFWLVSGLSIFLSQQPVLCILASESSSP
jgi:hypothetical protein